MIHPSVFQGAFKLGAVMAVKAKFLSQIVPLQTMLASRFGSAAAGIATSTLAGAAAAAYVAQKSGKSVEEQEQAAAEAGGQGFAREIVRWTREILVALVAAVAIAAAMPAPVYADTESQIRCSENGGHWINGKCDYSGPSAFDLFGQILIGGAILGILLGIGSADE